MWPLETDLTFDGIHLVDRPWFPYLCTEVENWEWHSKAEGAHYNLWINLDGEGTLHTSGQSFRLSPGMFFIFSPNQRIAAAHYSGARITRFSAHFIPLSGATVLDPVPGFPVLGRMVPSLALVRRRVNALMRLAFRREDDSLLERQLFELIQGLCSGGQQMESAWIDPRIAEAVQRMRRDPVSVPAMDDLAAELNYSRSHFDREFCRQVGQAPKRFLLTCKMIEARRYLESSRLRVGEIAERLGYRDIYFFSRQFKSFFKVSPTHYRKSFELEE